MKAVPPCVESGLIQAGRMAVTTLGLLVLIGAATVANGAYGPPAPAADEDAEDNAAAEADEAGVEAEQDHETPLRLGGALRFNAFYKDWPGQEDNRARGGDFAFDTFRVNADGTYQGIDLSLEYRFYAGYNMLHHGWVGHTFSNRIALEVGVTRKPFGLLPYASHNWFFNLGYYAGMEDDADLGVKLRIPSKALDIQLAFYKNDEGHYSGDSIDSARYSYDVVHSGPSELGYAGIEEPSTNEETNQLNGRVAYTFSHSDSANSEIGVSLEYGGLYNSTTGEMGNHWAAAVHWNGNYGRVNVMLQAAGYGFEPENPDGADRSIIVMGAYDAPYKVAARGSLFLANIAYTLPIAAEVVDSVRFYNNWSLLAKDDDRFNDSHQDVVGALVSSGKLFTYVDFAFGKNHPWLGPDYAGALAEGKPDAAWYLRFNINIGYYF